MRGSTNLTVVPAKAAKQPRAGTHNHLSHIFSTGIMGPRFREDDGN
jgi:hypothetical protein